MDPKAVETVISRIMTLKRPPEQAPAVAAPQHLVPCSTSTSLRGPGFGGRPVSPPVCATLAARGPFINVVWSIMIR